MAANHISLNLESLLKLSDSLNSTADEKFILNSALLSIMGKLRAVRGGVYQVNTNSSKYVSAINKGKIKHSEIDYFDLTLLQFPFVSEINLSCKMLIENGYQYLFPVAYQNEVTAFICLGSRLINEDLAEEEIKYVDLISRIAASAINNARNYSSLASTKNNLEQQNQLLNSIFEMSRDFSFFLSKENILKILSYRLMGQLMVTRFALMLKTDDNNYVHSINRFEKTIPEFAVKELENLKNTEKIKNITLSPETFKYFNSIKAKVFSPMIAQGEIKGFLIIGKRMNFQEFTDENIQFIEALGNRAIAALENERLFREELEKKRLESELNLALEIQTNLLPKEVPIIERYSVAGRSIPSRHVGGDYFDFIKLNDDELMTAIADVSGKGIPASLLMANVQAALRVLAPIKMELSEKVAKINSIVYQNTGADKFVTFFSGVLNTIENTFTYINAGHNPPILYSKNEIKLLSEGGLILGIMEETYPYTVGKVHLNQGDVICLYTDGISEAKDNNDEEFSEERIIDFIKNNNAYPAKTLLDELIKEVYYFSAHTAQYDDITAVFIKREV